MTGSIDFGYRWQAASAAVSIPIDIVNLGSGPGFWGRFTLLDHKSRVFDQAHTRVQLGR